MPIVVKVQNRTPRAFKVHVRVEKTADLVV
jgi:hypothetical protein